MISRGKIALIHVAKNRLGLDAVEYADLLAVGGVSSSRDLTDAGFRQVMDRLRELGFETRAGFSVESDQGYRYKAAGGASIRQIDKIKYLWRDITGHSITTPDHRATLYTFLYKHNGDLRHCDNLVEIWNQLDARTAHIMIRVLSEMLTKKNSPASPKG